MGWCILEGMRALIIAHQTYRYGIVVVKKTRRVEICMLESQVGDKSMNNYDVVCGFDVFVVCFSIDTRKDYTECMYETGAAAAAVFPDYLGN